MLSFRENYPKRIVSRKDKLAFKFYQPTSSSLATAEKPDFTLEVLLRAANHGKRFILANGCTWISICVNALHVDGCNIGVQFDPFGQLVGQLHKGIQSWYVGKLRHRSEEFGHSHSCHLNLKLSPPPSYLVIISEPAQPLDKTSTDVYELTNQYTEKGFH